MAYCAAPAGRSALHQPRIERWCAGWDEGPLINASKADLARVVARYLTKEDVRLLLHATGTPAHIILDRLDEEAVPAVLSVEKIVLHPLNAIGLHPLRALLMERVFNAVRERQFGCNGGTLHRCTTTQPF